MANINANPFYVPSGPMPNPFAEFWANFLQTRLPTARQIFTARLAELSSSQQNAALAKLAEQRVRLAEAMAENMRAREKNALDESLSESRLLGDWLDYHGTISSANTRAAADRDVARIGYAGRALEAGQLSAKSRDILGGYTEELRAGQIALQNATTAEDAQRAITQITEASNNAAAAAAAMPPLERNSFNNAVQQELGRLIVTDNADQAAVRRVVAPAFPPAPDIAPPEVTGGGARALTPESAAEAVRSLRSGMTPTAPAQPRAADSTPKPRLEGADPRRAKGPRGIRAPSARDIKRAERETSSGAVPRRGASPEGKGTQPASPPSGAGSPPSRAVTTPRRRLEGTGADAPLTEAASELDSLQARLEGADPFGGLGGFVDPLPGGRPRKPKGEGRSIVERLRGKSKAQENMGSVQSAMRSYDAAEREVPAPVAATPKATPAAAPKPSPSPAAKRDVPAPVATTPKAPAAAPKPSPPPAAKPTMGDVKLAEQRKLTAPPAPTAGNVKLAEQRLLDSDPETILKSLRPGESELSIDEQIRDAQPEQSENEPAKKPAAPAAKPAAPAPKPAAKQDSDFGSFLEQRRARETSTRARVLGSTAPSAASEPSAEEILRDLQPEQSSDEYEGEGESELTEEEIAELRKKKTIAAR